MQRLHLAGGYLTNLSAFSRVPDFFQFAPSDLFICSLKYNNKKCRPCSLCCHSAHTPSAQHVARLRHSVLLETCTRSHLNYAREHTVCLVAACIMPNVSVSAVGWIHHHLCPSSELCAWVTSVRCSQESKSKLPWYQFSVSF